MIDLKDKNIIITGATGGIGNSIVEMLFKCHANILATGTNKDKLEKLINKNNLSINNNDLLSNQFTNYNS